MSTANPNLPTREAPVITPATLESARESQREDEPCVSHLALREWQRMFDAWVKHQAGMPSEVPLWPNGDWSQDIAMVAHALVATERARADASNDANRLAIRVTELEKEVSSWKAVAHDHSERLKVLAADRGRMRAMLQKLAGECAECRGRGYTFSDDGIVGFGPDDREPTRESCSDCEDIREVLRSTAPLSDERDRVAELQAEVDRLRALINTPVTNDFDRAVPLEAAHQQERWQADHDAGKTPPDWFWLIGHLAGKSVHHREVVKLLEALLDDGLNGHMNAAFVAHLRQQLERHREKALHHTITAAAACRNWFRHSTGDATAMRPGIEPSSGSAS